METWSTHQLMKQGKNKLEATQLSSLKSYAYTLKSKKLPVIFTLNHLAKITGVPYLILLNTVKRRRESSNYKLFAIKKRSGGRRHIHSVHKHLHRVQQFINQTILQNIQPHFSAQAFHSGGGIRECAQMHCGARWLFQFDIEDFFYSINEMGVYEVFRQLGYRPLLAFEMARLCTTTRLPKFKQRNLLRHSHDYFETYSFYRTPHTQIGALPQGAASSPMLSNLACRGMDEDLARFACELGLVYTRYADDITLSCSTELPEGTDISDVCRRVNKIIRGHGFQPNKKKTHIAGPGSKKQVLGLLVDGDVPRLSKQTYKRIERLLYGCNKFGMKAVSENEGFDSLIGFHNHLSGLIAFTKDVDNARWLEFSGMFRRLPFDS